MCIGADIVHTKDMDMELHVEHGPSITLADVTRSPAGCSSVDHTKL